MTDEMKCAKSFKLELLFMGLFYFFAFLQTDLLMTPESPDNENERFHNFGS
jgi:hypothetical protein